MILRYNKNLYDEVINGSETYKAIATNIKKGFSTFISWTDNDSTHYDVLFTYGCVRKWWLSAWITSNGSIY